MWQPRRAEDEVPLVRVPLAMVEPAVAELVAVVAPRRPAEVAREAPVVGARAAAFLRIKD
jgi:hypothetical protein